ncbi:MAG: hypothetical protein RR240_10945 [Burkholderiaceae bacterium]
MGKVISAAIAVLALIALYLFAMVSWSYSEGDRAGWIQKFSRKGWICKTWEGELAMVSLPGSTPEKFQFTVWDPKVVAEIEREVGKRVQLHYEEKVGLPGSCFGDTRFWVNRVTVIPEIPLGPGLTVPTGPRGPVPGTVEGSLPPAPAAPLPPAPVTR